jgi:DNA-binding HxlR family transcriptional regulator
MAGKRSYGEACAMAHALDLVGERWALLVVRELIFGPKRFTDLREGMPHASPNVLAQRLRDLEAAGVVRHRKLGPPVGAQVYELTEWGAELEPVLGQLGRWGARSPVRPEGRDYSPSSMVLAMRTMFSPAAADGLDARYEIRLVDEVFRAEVADGALEIVAGEAGRPDVVVTTDVPTLGSLIFEGESVGAAERAGSLRLEGSKAAFKAFLGLFPMPELAEVPGESAPA